MTHSMYPLIAKHAQPKLAYKRQNWLTNCQQQTSRRIAVPIGFLATAKITNTSLATLQNFSFVLFRTANLSLSRHCSRPLQPPSRHSPTPKNSIYHAYSSCSIHFYCLLFRSPLCSIIYSFSDSFPFPFFLSVSYTSSLPSLPLARPFLVHSILNFSEVYYRSDYDEKTICKCLGAAN